MVVEWTRTAQKQLETILLYYQNVAGNKIAKYIVKNILKSGQLLAKFPKMAIIEPLPEDFPETYYSLVVLRLFKIVYYIDAVENKVVIVTIFDCRQNPDKLRQN